MSGCPKDRKKVNDPLILVNAKHAVPEVPSSGCLAPVSDSSPHILMEKTAAAALKMLLMDIGSGEKIVPVSGFRTKEEQQKIWDETMKKEGAEFTHTFVAMPGHSEHETGLAIDLAVKQEKIDFICPEFPRVGICGKFRRRAAKYGFVERYPAGKEAVTGIGAEPWHFRYVGVPHSMIMEERGMVLEEYIRFLERDTNYFRLRA